MRAFWKPTELDRHPPSTTQAADPLEHEQRRAVPRDELRRFEGDEAWWRRALEGFLEDPGGRKALGEVPCPAEVDSQDRVGPDLDIDRGPLRRGARTRIGLGQGVAAPEVEEARLPADVSVHWSIALPASFRSRPYAARGCWSCHLVPAALHGPPAATIVRARPAGLSLRRADARGADACHSRHDGSEILSRVAATRRIGK